MRPLLEAHDVTRVYGNGENQFSALKGATLNIDEGESVAIVGESGSGKSTLLHILAALDRPNSGDVRYREQSMSSLNGRKKDALRNREFGFVFQQFYLDERASVFENVTLPMMINDSPRTQRRTRAEEVLDRLGLKERIDSRAGQLSGGQRQRVAIARALINRPRVIFADEPTGALDTENGEAVARLLFELSEQEGITLVLVTHSRELASRCNRHVTIMDGLLTESESFEKRASE